MALDDRIVDLVLAWEEKVQAGQAVTPEDLCANCPELLGELRRRLQDLQAFDSALPVVVSVSAAEPPPDAVSGESWDRECADLRYRPARPLARGGLGEIHVAFDTELRRDVALKRIQPRRQGHPASQRRFVREAEITGRLEHPGIVPVYGLVEDARGQPCYAMRLIEGETLQAAIDRLHAPPQSRGDRAERGARFRPLLNRLVAVCNTIAFAHSRGVVHRDLKPANIMLGTFGETLVVDWGLARLYRTEAGAAADPEVTAAVNDDDTRLGDVIGTPAFMSPEQARGDRDAVGPASDIYSLGATLYNLLTGRRPFEEEEKGSTNSPDPRGAFPPPRKVNPEIPPALEAVCLKAMQPRPEDRYPEGLALAADLERWLADEPVTAYAEPWRARAGRWVRRHRTGVASAVASLSVAVLCLTVAAVWLFALNRQVRDERDRATKAYKRIFTAIDDSFTKTAKRIDQLRVEGQDVLVKELLTSAADHFQEAATQFESDPKAKYELARSYNRLALVHANSGQRDKRNEAFAKASELCDELLCQKPQSREYRRLLVDLCQMKEDFEKGVLVGRRLLDENPDDLSLRGALFSLLYNWSVDLFEKGKLLESWDRLMQAREYIRSPLEDPTTAELWARMHHGMAEVQRHMGKQDEAYRTLCASVADLEKLVQNHPDDAWLQWVLTEQLFDLTIAAPDKVAFPVLRESNGRMEKRYQEFLRYHPTAVRIQSALLMTHHNLGETWGEAGRRTEASAAFRRVKELGEILDPNRLSYSYRSIVQVRYAFAMAHANIALGLDPRGQRDERIALLKKSRDLFAAFVEASPELAYLHRDFGLVLDQLASDLARRGDNVEGILKQALERLDKATTLSQNGEEKKVIEALRDLCKAHGLRASGRPSEAARLALQVAGAEQFADKFPLLLGAGAELAQCSAADGRYATEAVKALERAFKAGFKDREELATNPDLDPIRGHKDFQQLLVTMKSGE